MESNRILIAGGSGLVGTALIQLLLKNDYGINVLSRNEKKINGVAVFKWDINKSYLNPEALKGVHTIINLSGSGIADQRWTPSRKEDLLKSRTQSTALLHQAVSTTNNQVKCFIGASAIGIYPESILPMHEDTLPANNFLGKLCMAWEKESMRFNELNIRTNIYRFGLVLSTQGGMLKELLPPFKLGIAPVFGQGTQQQSWIHINDICRMVLFAIENKNIAGVYNAVAPNPVSNEAMISALQDVRAAVSLKVNVPLFFLRLALGERVAVIAASQNVSAHKIMKQGFVFDYPILRDALSNLLNKEKP